MSVPEQLAAELLATMEENRQPKIGLYPRIPSEVYHQHWRAVGSTMLSHMQRSPAHARYAMDHPNEPTQAMIIGNAIHCAILEPDEFRARYACVPQVDLRTKAGKDAYADIALANPGKVLLRADEHDQCLAVRDSVNRHTFAMALLSGAGEFEMSAVWDHAGVRCKARTDRISFKIAGGTIVDLKSTRDARRDAFQRSIFAFRYFGQAAHYLEGMQENKVAVRHYTIIACEKEPPYAVGVYRMSPDVIEMGSRENEQLLQKFAECERTGNWPAYEDQVSDIGVPEWGWKQLEERIEP